MTFENARSWNDVNNIFEKNKEIDPAELAAEYALDNILQLYYDQIWSSSVEIWSEDFYRTYLDDLFEHEIEFDYQKALEICNNFDFSEAKEIKRDRIKYPINKIKWDDEK